MSASVVVADLLADVLADSWSRRFWEASTAVDPSSEADLADFVADLDLPHQHASSMVRSEANGSTHVPCSKRRDQRVQA